MAGKTLAELIDELLRELITLKAQFSGLQKEIDQIDLMTLRERVAVQEKLAIELKRLAEESERRGDRLILVEAQVVELKKQSEEKDRRWWQFWVGVGLVGFTFVANLVIQLILFFSRKSG